MTATPRLEWKASAAPVPYPEALAFMEARVREMRAGQAGPCVWLLEHPPLYTSGTSAKAHDLLDARFPVYAAGRGGEYTYHGPGQRVAYVMVDLKRLHAPQAPDLRAYVGQLEAWVMAALAEFGVASFTRPGRVGVWVHTPGGEAKIAALGVRVRGWVAFHGISVNVCPDLSHYAGIVPCGIRGFGVTSLQALGVQASLAEFDAALKRTGEWIDSPPTGL